MPACVSVIAESPVEQPAEEGPAAAASPTEDNKTGIPAAKKVSVEDAFPSFNQMAAAGIVAALQKPQHAPGLPALDSFSFANQQQADEVR